MRRSPDAVTRQSPDAVTGQSPDAVTGMGHLLAPYIPIDRRLALVRGETLPDRTNGAALFADVRALAAALALKSPPPELAFVIAVAIVQGRRHSYGIGISHGHHRRGEMRR